MAEAMMPQEKILDEALGDLSNLSEAGHMPPHAWLDEAVDAQGGVRRDGAKYQARAPHLVTWGG